MMFIGVIRRVQIARTSHELHRLGFEVSLPYARQARRIWLGLVAGFAGLVALIITTSVLAAAPSARTQASSAGSSSQGAPADSAVYPPDTNPGSEHTASGSTASHGVPSTDASAASSASPAADAGSDTGAPSAVSALPTSATAIQLAWTPVSGAARYDIERSTDSVAWNAVASTDGEQTGYTDVELSSGTTYYYRIAAFVDDDVSVSDIVSATTTGDTSSAPVLLSPTGSALSIELAWSDVDGELGYRVERSLDGTSGWTRIGRPAKA